MNRVSPLFCLVVLLLSVGTEVRAFHVEAHRVINELAGAASATANRRLREDVGIENGLAGFARGKSLLGWLGEGGVVEDAFPRFFSHFHTPLRPWHEAGLFHRFQSAARWAQAPLGSQRGSWWDARAAMVEALTATARDDRETALVHAFLKLGQVMHLVADMAQPAHTRNDDHPGQGVHLDHGFETFLTAERVRHFAGDIGFTGPLDRPSGDAAAPLPIAGLWDANAYTGGNPEVTAATKAGLAEFSNANFFSEDTTPDCSNTDPDRPFPRLDSLEPGPVVGGRPYLRKPRHGVTVDHIAAEGLFFRVTTGFCGQSLDDVVYGDYARLLVPRAIGYSRGVLDYFFRGEIDMVPDPANGERHLIRNPSEEPLSGTFELYYDDYAGARRPVPGARWLGDLAPGGELPVVFTAPTNPAPATPGAYVLVFRGRLGLEGEAGGTERFAVIAKNVTPCSIPFTTGALDRDGTVGCWHVDASINGHDLFFDGDAQTLTIAFSPFGGSDPYVRPSAEAGTGECGCPAAAGRTITASIDYEILSSDATGGGDYVRAEIRPIYHEVGFTGTVFRTFDPRIAGEEHQIDNPIGGERGTLRFTGTIAPSGGTPIDAAGVSIESTQSISPGETVVLRYSNLKLSIAD